jgi:hypothetical protein
VARRYGRFRSRGRRGACCAATPCCTSAVVPAPVPDESEAPGT